MAHFVEQWEELTDNKWVLSIVRYRFKIPFKSVPPLLVFPINLSHSSSPLLREEIAELLKKWAVERVQNPGTLGFYSRLFLVPKKNGKLRPVIDLSLLNHYIHKQHFKMETVKSVSQSIMFNDWAVSIDLTDAYLHVPIHPISRKYLRFVYDHQVFQFTALQFGMSLSPWIFTKLMNVIAAHLCLHAVSLFPYLDDWLIRDLLRNRLIAHTKYTLQTVQNMGFIPNLKKSDLIPTQQFTFIGMEFLYCKSSYSDHQNNHFSDSGFGTNFPFYFGQTQCSSRLKSSRQIAFTTSANVPVIGLETSYSSSRSSGYDQQDDQIPFKMVDEHQSFHSRDAHSPSRPKNFPL